MKKLVALISMCVVLSACSSTPDEGDLRDGFNNWLGANHAFATTFSKSTKIKIVECNKVEPKVFDGMNTVLRFSEHDKEGMKNLGYLCGISFDDDSAIPVFAVQSKKSGDWLAQPMFVPDNSVRNEIKKVFNVTN